MNMNTTPMSYCTSNLPGEINLRCCVLPPLDVLPTLENFNFFAEEIASVFLLGFKIRTMNRDVFPQLSFENGSKPNGIIAKKTKPDGKAKTTGFGMNRKLKSTNQFCKHDM